MSGAQALSPSAYAARARPGATLELIGPGPAHPQGRAYGPWATMA